MPQLEALHSSHFLNDLSIVMCIGYNIVSESKLNSLIYELANHMTQLQECNFGACICTKNSKKYLDVVPRDNPDIDMTEFVIDFINSKNFSKNNHIYDAIHQGLNLLPKQSTQSILIVFVSNPCDRPAVVKIEELQPFMHGCKVIIAELSNEPHALCVQLSRKYNISIVTLNTTLQNFIKDVKNAALSN